MATQPKPATPTDRHVAVTNLGRSLANLGRSIIGTEEEWTVEQDYRLGHLMDKALRAAVKATLPGNQKSRQVTIQLDAARKAMNRALARMVNR